MATVLNRTDDAITLKAGELGLTNLRRSVSIEARERMKAAAKQRILVNGSPNLGKKFGPRSEDAKRSTSVSLKRTFAKQREAGIGMFSEEGRQQRSDSMSRRRANGTLGGGNPYSRCAGGRRADLGDQFFRSSWEANIARYLNWMIGQRLLSKWEYEVDTFWFEEIKRGTRSYKPDFKIWDKLDSEPYYWEVKGWMDQKSKTKLERMKKYHPTITVHLIDQAKYNSIKRQVSSLIPNWE